MNIGLRKLSGTAISHTGAVYTPTAVARSLLSAARHCLPSRELRVLEPSVGDGVFLSAMLDSMTPGNFVAVDIDSQVIEALKCKHWKRSHSIAFEDRNFIDFFRDQVTSATGRYDLIIGNPPFIRKHNFNEEFKASLAFLSEGGGVPRDMLKNSWSAFAIASEQLLSRDGVMAFVLPYEILTVSYGQAVLRYLSNRFERLDVFVSDSKAFPDLDQDAVLLLCQKSSEAEPGTFLQRVQNFTDLSEPAEHSLNIEGSCIGLQLSSFLISSDLRTKLQDADERVPSIGTMASSAPGVVTAANDYFIVDDATVTERGLEDVVVPILRKGSQIPNSPRLSSEVFERLRKKDASNLLTLSGDWNTFPSPIRDYLAEGLRRGIDQRYKCRHRTPWYEVRLVRPAPLLFFKRAHALPRMCLNDAEVYVTDTAYGITPRDGFTSKGLCFSFYNSLTALFAEMTGRFYGGGVLELTPTELRGLPLIYHEPTVEEFEEFCRIYQCANGSPTPILDFGDTWLAQSTKFRELDIDLAEVREAWISVRSHRLRHSKSIRS